MAVVPDDTGRDETFFRSFERQFSETAVEAPFFKSVFKFFQARLLFADESRIYELIVFRDEKQDLSR